MNRWSGKVAVVTGASGGIGESIAVALAEAGMKVVGMSRNVKKLEELSEKIKNAKVSGTFELIKCDVEIEEDIQAAFAKVNEKFKRIDILINNAGLLVPESIIDGPTDAIKRTMAINAIAPALCAKAAIKIMREKNNFAHIINMNSQAGHNASAVNVPVSTYCASKYAVTALCETLRNELKGKTSRIKITSISPGGVRTNMIVQAGVPEEVLSIVPLLDASDVKDAVLYALGTPAHVNIHEIIIAAVEEVVTGDEPENK